MRVLLIALLLAGCSSIPIDQLSSLTPAQCRSYGVEVEDGTPITGTIVRSEFGWSHDIERECNISHYQGHSGSAAADTGELQDTYSQSNSFRFVGCAKAVEQTGPAGWISASHAYEIWYSDNLCVPEHEACHVLYETSLHTERFDIRTYIGDQFAACPAHRLEMGNRWPFKRG